MVLADAMTERYVELFTYPDPNMDAVSGSLSFARASGLREQALKYMSREEWAERSRDMVRGAETAAEEASGYREVSRTLAEKRQLERGPEVMGDKPLSVIICNSAGDYWRVYEEGVRVGNGTDEERRKAKSMLER